MSQQSNASIGATEALSTISEIKSFLKSTTEIAIEPYQFVVLGLFFYIYPVFESVTSVIRGSYHAYLAVNDFSKYQRMLSWTSLGDFSDAEYYLASYARELLYAVVLFYFMHWMARKIFTRQPAAQNPLAKKLREAINGIVLGGFLAGYAIAYKGTADHVLPMLVIGSGICFFIIGHFTRPIVRYLGVTLGVFGLVTLLSFGSHNPYLYNIIFFFTSSAMLGTGLLMMIENKLSGRKVK